MYSVNVRTLNRLSTSLIGALTTPHPVDRYLELVRPSWTLSEVRAEVVDVRRPTPGAVTIVLRANSAWSGMRAGQFVNVTVEIDGVQHRRCYSPASSAHGGRNLELTVRAHPEGKVSRYLNERAAPGMVLGLSQAEGDFALPEVRPERLLLVAGGSGITPLISMLRTLCDEGHEHPVTLLHYAPSRELAIYDAALRALALQHPNVNLIPAYTRDPAGAELRGYFSREHLAAAAPAYADAETFVCGPPALIEAVRSLWADEDLDARLHVEHFVPPAPSVVLGEAEGQIRFARSGIETENSGASLLDQAEAAGLTPESGCRMGICHSCTCRMVSGSVRNANTGEVLQIADEDVQICISVPVGDAEIEL